MTFDIDMIKKVYERYLKRVFTTKPLVRKPLTTSKKSFILAFGTEYYFTF
jgi:aconitate hydratase